MTTSTTAEERALRKRYLENLNDLLSLAVRTLERLHRQEARSELRRLKALGEKITTLKQVERLEKISWILSDYGGSSGFVGHELAIHAEMYFSRSPLRESDFERMGDSIAELRSMLGIFIEEES